MISHLQMITIFVSDLESSLEFYVNKLGFIELSTFDDGVDRLVWLVPEAARQDKHATTMALYAPKDPHDPRIGDVSGVVFTADNIEATYHELKSRGVPFTLDLIRHPYGEGDGDQEARFVDPDGNEFLLHT